MYLRGVRGGKHRWSVRLFSAVCAVAVMYLYSASSSQPHSSIDHHQQQLSVESQEPVFVSSRDVSLLPYHHRNLLSVSERSTRALFGNSSQVSITTPCPKLFP